MLPNEIIFVSGQRGSGKSYWVKNWVSRLPRVLIYDSLGEYQADERFSNPQDLIDRFIEVQNSTRLFTFAYDNIDMQTDFPMICRSVMAMGGLYFVVEELDLYSTPYLTAPELAKLIKYGRHYGIQLIGVSRRAAEVSRLFTSQATRHIIFGQREPNDLKYWRSMIGQQADLLPSLPHFNYLEADYNKQPVEITQKSPI